MNYAEGADHSSEHNAVENNLNWLTFIERRGPLKIWNSRENTDQIRSNTDQSGHPDTNTSLKSLYPRGVIADPLETHDKFRNIEKFTSKKITAGSRCHLVLGLLIHILFTTTRGRKIRRFREVLLGFARTKLSRQNRSSRFWSVTQAVPQFKDKFR